MVEEYSATKLVEVIVRLHNVRCPKELEVPAHERNDALLAEKRSANQILPGSKVIQTRSYQKGWRTRYLLENLSRAGLCVVDIHTEWRGLAKDKPVTTVSLRSDRAEDAARPEVINWLRRLLNDRSWGAGMMHLNPRVDGSFQAAIDLTQGQEDRASLPEFPVRPYLASS